MAPPKPPESSSSGLVPRPGPSSSQGTGRGNVQSHQSFLIPQSSGAISNSPKALRLGSTMRSTGDDYYRFEEMAKALRDELENATFEDNSTSFLLKAFPLRKILLTFSLPEIVEYLRIFNNLRPLYLNEYFGDQIMPPVQQSTPGAGNDRFSSVGSSRGTPVSVDRLSSVGSNRSNRVTPESMDDSLSSVGSNRSNRGTPESMDDSLSSVGSTRSGQTASIRSSPAYTTLSGISNYSMFYAFKEPIPEKDREDSEFVPNFKRVAPVHSPQYGEGGGSTPSQPGGSMSPSHPGGSRSPSQSGGGGGPSQSGNGGSNGGGSPIEPPELDDEQQFQRWLNHIADELDSRAILQGRSRCSKRFCADYSLTPMKGATPEKRKPDLVLITGDGLHPKCDGNWTSVWAVIEISREEDFKARLMKEIAQRAALIFHNSPGRRFVIILSISRRQFMLSVFHRSGVTHSKKFDLVKDLASFYFIIIAFLFGRPETLGFDPNILYKTPSMVPHKISIWGKIYEFTGTLFVREGIQGRGTVCWRVVCEETGKEFMLKLSWMNLNHPHTELYFYRKIFPKRIRGVPVLYSVQDAPKEDDTSRWEPANHTGFFVSRTCRKLLLDGVGRPITEFNTKQELLSAAIDLATVHHALYDADILHRDMSLWNLFLIDEYPEYPDKDPMEDFDLEARRYSDSQTSFSKGSQSSFPSSTESLSGAVAKSATGQVQMGQSISQTSRHAPKSTSTTVSRPPSSSAVTVSRPSSGTSYGVTSFSSTTSQATPQASRGTLPRAGATATSTQPVDVFSPVQVKLSRGLLADFDYAALLTKIAKENAQSRATDNLITAAEIQLRTRTGTLPFMAIEVLLGAGKSENFFHTFQHDIESLVYDLMTICITQSGPRGRQRNFKSTPLPSVYSGTARLPTDMWMSRDMTWVELGMQKVATWAHLEEWVLTSFHPYFDDMRDLFRDLALLLWPPTMDQRNYDRRVNCRVSYEDFIAVLRKHMGIVSG